MDLYIHSPIVVMVWCLVKHRTTLLYGESSKYKAISWMIPIMLCGLLRLRGETRVMKCWGMMRERMKF
jgi:hypothetical protein